MARAAKASKVYRRPPPESPAPWGLMAVAALLSLAVWFGLRIWRTPTQDLPFILPKPAGHWRIQTSQCVSTGAAEPAALCDQDILLPAEEIPQWEEGCSTGGR